MTGYWCSEKSPLIFYYWRCVQYRRKGAILPLKITCLLRTTCRMMETSQDFVCYIPGAELFQVVLCELPPELGSAMPSALGQACTSYSQISSAEQHGTEISIPQTQHRRPRLVCLDSTVLHGIDLPSPRKQRHLPPSCESLQVEAMSSSQRVELSVKLCSGANLAQKCLQSVLPLVWIEM